MTQADNKRKQQKGHDIDELWGCSSARILGEDFPLDTPRFIATERKSV
jgi:hypothetical protein